MKKMDLFKYLVFFFTLITHLSIQAEEIEQTMYITVGSDAIDEAKSIVHLDIKQDNTEAGITILEINSNEDLLKISEMMHEKFNRCGGFVLHDDMEDALATLNSNAARSWAEKSLFADYSINQGDIVRDLINNVEESNMLATIKKLSSYKNRYYKSKTGKEAALWIHDQWENLAAARSDVKVEKFVHPRWGQPSIMLTIQGKSDDTIIVGGHLDSIAGYFRRERATAPGADDNASGISVLTEVIRILMNKSYAPEKTIVFIGYAAEEVGLLGSKEIALKMKNNNRSIIGVLQLDMTNFNGSDLDIVMMTDFTNAEQNAFLGNLIDEYLTGVSWGYDKCGYGCSDHASWHNQGYPASMPFETRKNEMNKHIHSARDTIEKSGNSAEHAAKFARMALAFVVELDK